MTKFAMKRKRVRETFEEMIRTDGIETWWITLPNNFKLASPGEYVRVTVERIKPSGRGRGK